MKDETKKYANKVGIREADTEEFEEIGQLMIRVYAGLEGFPGPTDQPGYYQMLADIGKMAERDHTELLVAQDMEGTILGAVVYFSDMSVYGSGGTATKISNASGFRLLAVDPEARGKGIGSLLIRECIRKTKQNEHPQLIIHSTESMKTARELYKKLGFIRFEEIDFHQGDLPVFGFKYVV